MICDICGDEDGVVQCSQCSLKSCAASRTDDKCPQCGASVADNAKCSVSGGCGTGSQEDP